MIADEQRIASLRDRLEIALEALVPDLAVNGDRRHRLAGNLHVSAAGAPNDQVVAQLRETVAISTGAACASGADAPSHVLKAMGLPTWRQEGALRIGLGRLNTETEIDFAADTIATAIRTVRAL
jgi:cysteine desulfurase